ncbi:MAG: 16S rRNA (adenine(1518)-N(6)/adenine(1519)-N(6))-dimethyltransferase RsmA [Cyanophyceae cyanobacterium]
MARARKRFGQHWLKSDTVLKRIADAADLSRGDRVLEIGPGQGALTHQLLPKAGAVVAVELDRDLCPRLVKKFGDRDNFLLLQGDILKLDWPQMIEDFPNPAFREPNKVVANIPYNITGPILEHLLGRISTPRSHPFESIVLLVQQEVGRRLCAKPGHKAYGALSIRVGFLADCEYLFDVPAKAFSPPPKVMSAVIRITPRPYPEQPKDHDALEKLVKQGFSTRRKMLRNNLKSWIESDPLTKILTAIDVRPDARAENLSIGDWIHLSDRLSINASGRDTGNDDADTDVDADIDGS